MEDRAKLKVTLKSGSTVWEEGTVFDYPFPPEIEQEILLETGTVELVKGLQTRMVHGIGRNVEAKVSEIRTRRVIRS